MIASLKDMITTTNSHSFLDEEKPSLLEIVFKYLANNLDLVCRQNPDTEKWECKEDILIPNEVCDRCVVNFLPHKIYTQKQK